MRFDQRYAPPRISLWSVGSISRTCHGIADDARSRTGVWSELAAFQGAQVCGGRETQNVTHSSQDRSLNRTSRWWPSRP